MPSATLLESLPSVNELQSVVRALASLDVIQHGGDDDWLRKYDYQPQWSPGVAFGKYDNGGGDEMIFFFKNGKAVIKGFAHESNISPYANDSKIWPGMYEGIPADLNEELTDPAAERGVVTFCVWNSEETWQCGPVEFSKNEDDGSELLHDIFFQPEDYVAWAEEDLEVDLDLKIVKAIYAGEQITDAMIKTLNPQRDIANAQAELADVYS